MQMDSLKVSYWVWAEAFSFYSSRSSQIMMIAFDLLEPFLIVAMI
jgi:hypothetical protein